MTYTAKEYQEWSAEWKRIRGAVLRGQEGFEKGRSYTSDELERIVALATFHWESNSKRYEANPGERKNEYDAVCDFVMYAPMEPDEQAKLRESFVIEAFLHA